MTHSVSLLELTRAALCWLLLLFSVGCGVELESPIDDPQRLDASSLASSDGLICAPYTIRCPSLLESAVCSGDGTSWESVPCMAGEVCQEGDGGCVGTFCDSFSTECTGDQSFRACSADGMA